MATASATIPNQYPGLEALSVHARVRMDSRHISPEAVLTTLEHGREVHTRGATIYAIGRKEVTAADGRGINLKPVEGVHVVCARDGQIITTYRNRSLGGLRPRQTHYRRER